MLAGGKRREFLAVVVLSAILATAACSSATLLYPGPKRPDAEVSVIEVDRVAVQVVDGHAVDTAQRRFEVLPGSHMVTLRRDRMDRTVCFKARPGHTYLARPVRGNGTWHPEVIDENVAQAIHTDEMSSDAIDCPSAAAPDFR